MPLYKGAAITNCSELRKLLVKVFVIEGDGFAQ